MLQVPFLDVRAAYRELQEAIDASVRRIFENGHYVLGEEITHFEREFAAYVGAQHCVGIGSGLDALHLALRAMGIGAGDEVIVPANTYIATWLAISHAGATIVPVDPDERTYNMTPDRVEEAITSKTKAILPVNLYGQPAPLAHLNKLAEEKGLLLLQDASQAHGARSGESPLGAIGTAAAWSFYPTKNLGALGDAGAVTTNDKELAERLRCLRNYGATTKYENVERGWNSRLDPVQAAILRVKLKTLDDWNERRKNLAELYLTGLAHTELRLPQPTLGTTPAWHLFVVRTSKRDALLKHLGARGIGTGLHYPTPPHLQPAYRDLGFAPGNFPITEALAAEVLSLPMGPHLLSADAERVVDSVQEYCSMHKAEPVVT